MRTAAFFKTFLFTSLALTLAACEVGPDYKEPETVLPDNWKSGENTEQKTGGEKVSSLSARAEIDQKWWENFNDPVLNGLIEKAVANNLDLKAAEARIAEARASVSSATAALFPTGSLNGSATREANQMALPGGSADTFAPLLHKPFNIYEAGFDASWEMDLFGGNRRTEETAEAQMQASEATRDDLEVSMLAEVAKTYVDIRAAEAQLSIALEVVASDEKTLEIARQRFEAGDAPRLDVTEAEAALEQAETKIPDFRNAKTEAEYKMDVLLGEQPGATRDLVGRPSSIPVTGRKLVMAAPASVIAQRPDIRVAERKLAAATAQQGVAVAKFFPDISLSGFFGALNTSTNRFLTGTNQSWLAGANVVWPILSYGTLSANLENANAEEKEALVTYQKTILSALSDVERSLNAYNEQEKFLQSTSNEVEKDLHAKSIAEERYKEGLTSLEDVLEADRKLYTAQNDLAIARADDTEDLIAVYKSLGGGWTKKPAKEAKNRAKG